MAIKIGNFSVVDNNINGTFNDLTVLGTFTGGGSAYSLGVLTDAHGQQAYLHSYPGISTDFNGQVISLDNNQIDQFLKGSPTWNPSNLIMYPDWDQDRPDNTNSETSPYNGRIRQTGIGHSYLSDVEAITKYSFKINGSAGSIFTVRFYVDSPVGNSVYPRQYNQIIPEVNNPSVFLLSKKVVGKDQRGNSPRRDPQALEVIFYLMEDNYESLDIALRFTRNSTSRWDRGVNAILLQNWRIIPPASSQSAIVLTKPTLLTTSAGKVDFVEDGGQGPDLTFVMPNNSGVTTYNEAKWTITNLDTTPNKTEEVVVGISTFTNGDTVTKFPNSDIILKPNTNYRATVSYNSKSPYGFSTSSDAVDFITGTLQITKNIPSNMYPAFRDDQVVPTPMENAFFASYSHSYHAQNSKYLFTQCSEAETSGIWNMNGEYLNDRVSMYKWDGGQTDKKPRVPVLTHASINYGDNVGIHSLNSNQIRFGSTTTFNSISCCDNAVVISLQNSNNRFYTSTDYGETFSTQKNAGRSSPSNYLVSFDAGLHVVKYQNTFIMISGYYYKVGNDLNGGGWVDVTNNDITNGTRNDWPTPNISGPSNSYCLSNNSVIIYACPSDTTSDKWHLMVSSNGASTWTIVDMSTVVENYDNNDAQWPYCAFGVVGDTFICAPRRRANKEPHIYTSTNGTSWTYVEVSSTADSGSGVYNKIFVDENDDFYITCCSHDVTNVIISRDKGQTFTVTDDLVTSTSNANSLTGRGVCLYTQFKGNIVYYYEDRTNESSTPDPGRYGFLRSQIANTNFTNPITDIRTE